jgi:hypothetical protein
MTDTKLEEIIEEAKRNPASNAVLHAFAVRKRTRATIMLASLYNAMKKEGFNYPRSEYIPVIKSLAKAGVGSLILDKKGKVRGLKDIKVTLQSLGAAVANTPGVELRPFKERNRFLKIAPKPEVLKNIQENKKAELNLELILSNHKAIKIPIPSDLEPKELVDFITKLKNIY